MTLVVHVDCRWGVVLDGAEKFVRLKMVEKWSNEH